jgi:hypothetical protein
MSAIFSVHREPVLAFASWLPALVLYLTAVNAVLQDCRMISHVFILVTAPGDCRMHVLHC